MVVTTTKSVDQKESIVGMGGDGDHVVDDVDVKWSNSSRSSSGISVAGSSSEDEASLVIEESLVPAPQIQQDQQQHLKQQEQRLQLKQLEPSASVKAEDCHNGNCECCPEAPAEKDGGNVGGGSAEDFNNLLDESFEETPLLTSVVTIIGYGVLVVFGYFRDWLRRYGFEAIYSAKEPNKGPGAS